METGAMHPENKHEGFYHVLRERITSSAWRPGERLPNRTDLCLELDTSLATIQKALDRLRDDGFIRARGRAGTFVADRLPSEYRVAVALQSQPEQGRPWSRMWQALEYEATQINAAGHREVRFYYGMGDRSSASAAQLARDLQNQTLAGVFWAAMPARELHEMPWAQQTRVIAMSGDADQFSFPSVRLTPYQDRVLDFMQSCGRRRIGLVNSAMAPSNLPLWQSGLARRGLVFDPYCCINAYPVESDAVRVAVYHMVRQAPEHRPDALLVVDDHMVEPVTAALRDAGASAPDDVLVVAHCNYPLPPVCHVPVKFIGFDLADLLDRVVNWIAPNGQGEPATPMVFEAKFDHELPAERRRRQVTVQAEPTPRPRLTLSAQQYLTVSAFG